MFRLRVHSKQGGAALEQILVVRILSFHHSRDKCENVWWGQLLIPVDRSTNSCSAVRAPIPGHREYILTAGRGRQTHRRPMDVCACSIVFYASIWNETFAPRCCGGIDVTDQLLRGLDLLITVEHSHRHGYRKLRYPQRCCIPTSRVVCTASNICRCYVALAAARLRTNASSHPAGLRFGHIAAQTIDATPLFRPVSWRYDFRIMFG
jgi:hypothetical protein